MKDVQNSKDDRNVYLNEVGVKNVIFPIEIRNSKGEWMPATADISMFADLEPDQKGTHMSRFVEIMQQNRQMDLSNIKRILTDIRERLEAMNSFLNVAFDYFIWKRSPVTDKESAMAVKVEYNVSLRGDKFEFGLTVHTPVTTLCPCSKEISDYSAHNQRAIVSITVMSEHFVWIEDLVSIAEEAASSPVYTLLKRPDEKFVTEYAYDHPKFVEDVAREVKLKMDQMDNINEYMVEVESQESIHNHSAYAKVVGRGKGAAK